jgi:hypothetical protein
LVRFIRAFTADPRVAPVAALSTAPAGHQKSVERSDQPAPAVTGCRPVLPSVKAPTTRSQGVLIVMLPGVVAAVETVPAWPDAMSTTLFAGRPEYSSSMSPVQRSRDDGALADAVTTLSPLAMFDA